VRRLDTENFPAPVETNRGKAILVGLLALSVVLVSLFWAAILLFQIAGWPLYFLQLSLYLILFLLALWGLRGERIGLPLSARSLFEALAYTLASWMFFVLAVRLSGLARLPEEFRALGNAPLWKIGAQIVSTWLFVGMGEEFLFRGYFLQAFRRYFSGGEGRRRTAAAVLLVSVFFSLWHLPNRVIWLATGEIDPVLFAVSLSVLFLLGLGYAYLFLRSNNILLVGLVHGVSDYPLVGMDSQLTPVILLAAIGCVEAARWAPWKRSREARK
jgi:membrane protease YdiL (CAAX protease family)